MLTELKAKAAEKIKGIVEASALDIVELFELPKALEHGHLALPVFFLAKTLRKAPPLIAKELAEKIGQMDWSELDKADPVGGYINLHFHSEYLQKLLGDAVCKSGSQLGFGHLGHGQKAVVDYSSPNVAKQMTIGHLRATVIGQAICNLARSQGYEVIGLNHLGDWGTQFGKLAWAIENWGEEYPLDSEPMDSLTKLYVRFHAEAEKNPEIENQGATYFKRLEEGDQKIKALWRKIVDLSLKDYNRLWTLLGVKHDLVRGESFYNDRLKPTEELLEKKGLLVQSQGAMVVELGEGKPPCLIRKADGASLYATRDLASAIYRMEELKADLNIYVVGQDQTLHFQQIFAVLKKMGFAWADRCYHIAFGMYRFKDIGRMSTRKGNVIHLEDVLTKSVTLAREIIAEKNPKLINSEDVAKKVGVGAIIFNDLNNDRVKNVDFDWERVLSFEGDSGPYVQYCVVRCKSLIRKYGKKVPLQFSSVLDSDEERSLIKLLLQLDHVLAGAFKVFKPHILANYLLDVCRSFNHFYHKQRILGEEPSLESSRMVLVYCAMRVLEQGLAVLNIEAPEEM